MTTPTPSVIVQVPGEWAWDITCSKCGQTVTMYEGTKRAACISFINTFPRGMVNLKTNTAYCGSC